MKEWIPIGGDKNWLYLVSLIAELILNRKDGNKSEKRDNNWNVFNFKPFYFE